MKLRIPNRSRNFKRQRINTENILEAERLKKLCASIIQPSHLLRTYELYAIQNANSISDFNKPLKTTLTEKRKLLINTTIPNSKYIKRPNHSRGIVSTTCRNDVKIKKGKVLLSPIKKVSANSLVKESKCEAFNNIVLRLAQTQEIIDGENNEVSTKQIQDNEILKENVITNKKWYDARPRLILNALSKKQRRDRTPLGLKVMNNGLYSEVKDQYVAKDIIYNNFKNATKTLN